MAPQDIVQEVEANCSSELKREQLLLMSTSVDQLKSGKIKHNHFHLAPQLTFSIEGKIIMESQKAKVIYLPSGDHSIFIYMAKLNRLKIN